MQYDFVTLTTILSLLAFSSTAIASWFQPGLRPHVVKSMAVGSSLVAILSALISGIFVVKYGLLQSSLIGISNLGFSLRFDALSLLMFSMIAIIGFVVVKFSLNYLDGDDRQGRFIGRLAATIASVQLFVLAGNLALFFIAWILTSISLHRLLVFYADRPGAVIAARKKFIVARLADVCLFAAVVLLYIQFNTGNLEEIFNDIKIILSSGTASGSLEVVALLLVFAALLKSAQFPTHGWLIEVMETPTPVSALLHAGLLNAGPFLLIRMAFIMESSTFASIVIMLFGGFTALFASAAFLTQTSIKTALGYSSVAHMGFSLMLCGLGAYPVAMLHLVAHSFYKAHAFLSSGSIIDVIRGTKIRHHKRAGNPLTTALAIVLAIGLYIGFAMLLRIDLAENLPLFAIGGIIVMGLSTLFASALDTKVSIALLARATVLAAIVVTAFFTLELGIRHLLASQLPLMSQLNFVEIILLAPLLFAFAVVVAIQMLAPSLHFKPAYRAFAVHLKNGFYANALFDRMIGSLRIHNLKSISREIEKIQSIKNKNPIPIKKLDEQTA